MLWMQNILSALHASLRAANPVEEMGRSWNRKPRGLDLLRGQHRVLSEQYRDGEGEDQAAAREFSHARRVRKESLLREYGLLKY